MFYSGGQVTVRFLKSSQLSSVLWPSYTQIFISSNLFIRYSFGPLPVLPSQRCNPNVVVQVNLINDIWLNVINYFVIFSFQVQNLQQRVFSQIIIYC